MIEKLTPEQEARLPEFVERGLKIGLSCEPIDVPKASKAVADCYTQAGLAVPEIVFVRSPKEAAELSALLLDLPEGDKTTGAEMRERLRAGIVKPARTATDALSSCISVNNYEAGWIMHRLYFKEVLGLSGMEALDPLVALAESCGVVGFLDACCVVSERPQFIRRDPEHRLHCEDGPAIRFSDGFAIYAWHGTQVPADWIANKDKLDVSIALTWANIEQRRAAAEIIGWVKVLSNLNPTVVDEDSDPQIGTLVRVRLPGTNTDSQFLLVVCPTGRLFALPVSNEVRTAKAANASTYGLTEEEFNLAARA